MTPAGIEPALPPWKGDVLTAWPWSPMYCSVVRNSWFSVIGWDWIAFSNYSKLLTEVSRCSDVLLCKNRNYSPSWARTNNPSVNSRVLYHWAIEEDSLCFASQNVRLVSDFLLLLFDFNVFYSVKPIIPSKPNIEMISSYVSLKTWFLAKNPGFFLFTYFRICKQFA